MKLRIPLQGLLAAILTSGAPLAGNIPVTGLPVPQLSGIDTAVAQSMDNLSISGATVGIMKDGRIVYQRGFGWRDSGKTQALPENATMRLASVSKVFVKEALKRLRDEGLDLDSKVFDLGQPGGGILDIEPWPSCQDARLQDVTIQQLLDMRVYWAEDYAWDSIEIYEAMGLDGDEGYPPPLSLVDMTRYALGQTMLYDPGMDPDDIPEDDVLPYGGYPYSNFGYNVLVLVIEELTGQSFYSYLRQNLMTRSMWIPSTDFFVAQPFATTGLREPHYFSGSTWQNVYDPNWGDVPAPYGGFNVEAMIGSSFLACSTAPLLTYGENYSTRWIGNMSGSSSIIYNSAEESGVRIAVICNDTMQGNEAAEVLALVVDNVIGNGVAWPTKEIDGQWIGWDANAPLSGEGSYDTPYGSVDAADNHIMWGTKLLFQSGDHPFTGTLSKKLLLKAPIGAARIGKNGP